MTTLTRKEVTARKRHRCGFCGHAIERGERYSFSTHAFDGRAYTWRSHLKCQELCDVIWDYVDPDDGGMGRDDFRDGLYDVACAFVCPGCPHYDADSDDCDCRLEMSCIDRIHGFFQKFRLVRTDMITWKIKPKGNESGNERQ